MFASQQLLKLVNVKKSASFFRKQLLQWAKKQEDRDMPWKGIKDPYKIWLSEIILQQTRVEQGRSYYLKFVENYPCVEDLASADEEEVMKLWQGLGYYSRARNLHTAAQYIVNECGAEFPTDYEGILKLKGVGPYTAAAISSFAYNLPHAVVDGNVYRVLSRFYGIDTPIDSTAGKKEFQLLAQETLHPKKPAEYNQAIMDFGATLCKPGMPDCSSCPMEEACQATGTELLRLLPVKEKKLKKKNRFFYYFVVKDKDGLFLKKRMEKDIWQHLFDFPMEESNVHLKPKEILQKRLDAIQNLSLEHVATSKPYKQVLSHQNITAYYLEMKLTESAPTEWGENIYATQKELEKYAFPRIVERYLLDKSLISMEA